MKVSLAKSKEEHGKQIYKFQSQINTLKSEMEEYERLKQIQVELQRQYKILTKQKEYVLDLVKEDDRHKAQNLEFQSQIEMLKKER